MQVLEWLAFWLLLKGVSVRHKHLVLQVKTQAVIFGLFTVNPDRE